MQGGWILMVAGCQPTSVGPPKFVSWGGKSSVGNGFCRLGQNFPTVEKKKKKKKREKNLQIFFFDANSKISVFFSSKTERFWLKFVGWAQILLIGPKISQQKTKNFIRNFFLKNSFSAGEFQNPSSAYPCV